MTEETSQAGRPSFEIPPPVLYREVDGELVLLNLETEHYFGLNAIGADIVERVVARPFEQAMESLLTDYEVDSATLYRDVRNLVDALVEAGLLVRVDGSA